MRPLAATAALLVLLAGCGQTGPLYLPDEEPPHEKPSVTRSDEQPAAS